MDRQQELQEKFNKYFSNLFPEEGKPFVFVSSVSAAMEKAKDCVRKGNGVKAKNNVIASGYYCLASFVCLEYMLENGMVASLFDKGNEAAKRALAILPEDYEYQIFTLLYRIVSINVDKDGAESAFEQLQQIHRECPPFHIVSNALFKPEWLEDVYNHLFEKNLQDVCFHLDDNERLQEEAFVLLKSFPETLSKLMAFYGLAGTYLSREKNDEALRNAKLGVEVLGNNVEYDYHKYEHWIWGECWALVGVISRDKKDYDFAMSVLEKGARLGIITCMTNLAEMYENGEGEDPDPSLAEEYRLLSKRTQERRDREKEEEEERIRIEEEKKRREIEEEKKRKEIEEERKRREIEEREKVIALEREQKKREDEILTHKSWLTASIVVLSLALVLCVVNLCQKDILDSVAKSLKRGDAVIELKRTTEQQYALIMDKKEIKYKDLHTESRILKVAASYPVSSFSLLLNNGLKIIREELDDTFSVTSSKRLNIRRISGRSYLVTPQRIQNPVDTKGIITNAYLIVTTDTGSTSVLRIPNGSLDGSGNIIMTFKDSVLPLFQTYLSKHFNKKDFEKILNRHYCDYSVDVVVKLANGSVNFAGNVFFSKLGINCVADQLDSDLFKNLLANKIRELFRAEYEDGLFTIASKLTGVYNRSRMKLSPDDRYTFVIDDNYYSGKNSTALLSVNNSSKKVSVLDAGMQVLFRESSIYVKRHTTFLLFFSSSEDVYYDYYGRRL